VQGREVLVELGVSAGAGIDGDLRTLRAGARQRALTEHILALADQAGYGAVLIEADPSAAQGTLDLLGPLVSGVTDPRVITWAQFAHMIRAAVRGLSRRGLRESDAVGIFVHDAVRHVVAVQAVRAAGALAAPVGPTRDAAHVAARLKDCRARLLITSAPLAELAIEAAERSWVRQVFAFGEADGTTPFGSLLHTAKHGQTHPVGRADLAGGVSPAGLAGPADPAVPAVPGGSAGAGREAVDGSAAARMPDLAGFGLNGPVPRLTSRDVVVAAPPCGDPDAYTALLDLTLAAGATIVAAPLPQVNAAVAAYKGTAAIVPHGRDVPGLHAGRVLTAGLRRPAPARGRRHAAAQASRCGLAR
jgi:acyl-CoA synthetase (AMP-forming)/AMP-acid ligase II